MSDMDDTRTRLKASIRKVIRFYRKKDEQDKYARHGFMPALQLRRELTIPNSSQPELWQSRVASDQLTHLQSQSTFLSLPYELRESIYMAALGNRLIDILFNHSVPSVSFLSPERTNSRQSESSEGEWNHIVYPMSWYKRLEVLGGHRLFEVHYTYSFEQELNMALLRTCRKIYSEAIGILYNRNTFRFASPSLLIDFRNSIRPQRFASLSSIHIDWPMTYSSSPLNSRYDREYNRIWSKIATVPRLRYLRVAVHAPSRRGPSSRDFDIQKEDWLPALEYLEGRELRCEIMMPPEYVRALQGEEFAPYELKEFNLIPDE